MTTGKLMGLTLLASASLVTAAAAEPVADGGRKFTTPMSGAEEVPPADPDGSGTGSVTINVGQQRVCWDFTISNIAAPHRGHIHRAPAGSNGPIVVDFFNLSVGTPGPLSGCSTANAAGAPYSRELLTDIIQNPSSYYLNLHNADYLGGAIRGQLEKKQP